MGEDEFWIYDDDDDDDSFEDDIWEYFDEAAAAAEEASRPQFLKERKTTALKNIFYIPTTIIHLRLQQFAFMQFGTEKRKEKAVESARSWMRDSR